MDGSIHNMNSIHSLCLISQISNSQAQIDRKRPPLVTQPICIPEPKAPKLEVVPEFIIYERKIRLNLHFSFNRHRQYQICNRQVIDHVIDH